MENGTSGEPSWYNDVSPVVATFELLAGFAHISSTDVLYYSSLISASSSEVV